MGLKLNCEQCKLRALPTHNVQWPATTIQKEATNLTWEGAISLSSGWPANETASDCMGIKLHRNSIEFGDELKRELVAFGHIMNNTSNDPDQNPEPLNPNSHNNNAMQSNAIPIPIPIPIPSKESSKSLTRCQVKVFWCYLDQFFFAALYRVFFWLQIKSQAGEFFLAQLALFWTELPNPNPKLTTRPSWSLGSCKTKFLVRQRMFASNCNSKQRFRRQQQQQLELRTHFIIGSIIRRKSCCWLSCCWFGLHKQTRSFETVAASSDWRSLPVAMQRCLSGQTSRRRYVLVGSWRKRERRILVAKANETNANSNRELRIANSTTNFVSKFQLWLAISIREIAIRAKWTTLHQRRRADSIRSNAIQFKPSASYEARSAGNCHFSSIRD